MLKFHPYSILTGDARVEFVIFCVLMVLLSILLNKLPDGFVFAQSGTESMIAIMQKAHFAVNIFLFDCQNWLCNFAFLTKFFF